MKRAGAVLAVGVVCAAVFVSAPSPAAADVGASVSVCVAVPGASAGDTAVVNITNVRATGGGFGAIRSSDEPSVFSRDAADQFSSVNFAANTPANPNLAFTRVGVDGEFCYDNAVASSDVLLDLAATIPAGNIDTIDPTRLLDTRATGAVGASGSVCVAVPGASAGDTAVVNITNVRATGGGFGAIRSSDEPSVFSRDAADQFSSVNFAANTPANPNLAFTRVGVDGEFCYDNAVASSDVLLDLAATIPAGNIDTIDPTRLLDTRATGAVGASGSVCVAVPGASAGDTAVVNITNVRATGGGFGAIRSSDEPSVFSRDAADQFSSVNFAANTPANPNLAFTRVGVDGEFCYDNAVASSDVLLDLAATIPAGNIDTIDPTRLLDTRSPSGQDSRITTDDIRNMDLPIGTCFSDTTRRSLTNGYSAPPDVLGQPVIWYPEGNTPEYLDIDGRGTSGDATFVVLCSGGGTAVWRELIVWPVDHDPYVVEMDEVSGFPPVFPDLFRQRASTSNSLVVTWGYHDRLFASSPFEETFVETTLTVTTQSATAERVTVDSPLIVAQRVAEALSARDPSGVNDRISMGQYQNLERYLDRADEIDTADISCRYVPAFLFECILPVGTFSLYLELETDDFLWKVAEAGRA